MKNFTLFFLIFTIFSLAGCNKTSTSIERNEGGVLEDVVAGEKDTALIIEYEDSKFNKIIKNNYPILYFTAEDCEECDKFKKEFQKRLEEIPANTVIFEFDFATEEERKKNYFIFEPDSFVQINKEGEIIAKWEHGGVDTLLQKIKKIKK